MMSITSISMVRVARNTTDGTRAHHAENGKGLRNVIASDVYAMFQNEEVESNCFHVRIDVVALPRSLVLCRAPSSGYLEEIKASRTPCFGRQQMSG
jgi:hypothetical protein